jgi:hypothetical protein
MIGDGSQGNGGLPGSAAYVESVVEALDAGKVAETAEGFLVKERAHLRISRRDFLACKVIWKRRRQ